MAQREAGAAHRRAAAPPPGERTGTRPMMARQALIDAGQRPGIKSFEADPLQAARRRQRPRGRARDGEGGQRSLRGGRCRPKRKFQVVRGLNIPDTSVDHE